MWSIIVMTLLMMMGVMMIGIILLQRGRGGGLAGAFGGMGGQSALGTKAGDVFTKITVVIAVLWVILAGVSGLVLENSRKIFAPPPAPTVGPPTGGEEDKTEKPFIDQTKGKGGDKKSSSADKKNVDKKDGKNSDADNKDGAGGSDKDGDSTGTGSDTSDKKKTPATGEKNK